MCLGNTFSFEIYNLITNPVYDFPENIAEISEQNLEAWFNKRSYQYLQKSEIKS